MYESAFYRPTALNVLKGAARGAAKLPRLVTARARVTPDFLIIGVQRGGTSSLYADLSRHPALIGAFRKELHYFDLHFDRGINWYRAHFPSQHRCRRVHARTGAVRTGEATPYYLFHPLAAQRIAQTLPHVKLIVMLRNPVDRALSHYHHEVRCGFETLSFEEALDREPQRLAGQAQRLIRGQTSYSKPHLHFSYLARGCYAGQLERWFEHYPREQFLILKSEDYFTQPVRTLERVTTFLDLPPMPGTDGPVKINDGQYARMDQSVRNRLADYYRPHNQRLYDLLGADMGWNE